MKTISSLLSGAAAVALLAAGAASAAEWKFALEEQLNEVQGVFATRFKEHVEANSDHTVAIFPYGSLGESADVTELTQLGAVQFANASPGFMGSEIPELNVFLLPYTLPEEGPVLADFFATSPTIYQDLAARYEDQGLSLVVMYPEGEVVMTTKEPVASPADLDGVKFRVMTSPLLVETYRAFGATPTPLPWGEVFSSLQLNMIQGQENPMFFVESTKMYEVTDHITYAGHNVYTTAVVANSAFLDGLSEEDRAVVDAATQAAFEHIMEYQEGLTQRAEDMILKAKPDMNVTVLTDEQRAPFRAAAEDVRATYVEMVGEAGSKILDGFAQDVAASRERVGD
ncbi:MAG: TRAP transporter substrate-binding protein DctP [Rubrimonas sp.]|uniref:TRAP transporter substrate-binding protein DctP n=1 Tax=Rubrimonas sp. TaxID=2036015 RepID=UPI002FDEB842